MFATTKPFSKIFYISFENETAAIHVIFSDLCMNRGRDVSITPVVDQIEN